MSEADQGALYGRVLFYEVADFRLFGEGSDSVLITFPPVDEMELIM